MTRTVAYGHVMDTPRTQRNGRFADLQTRLLHSERNRLCVHAGNRRDYTFLCRQTAAGRIVRPYPGMFARTERWEATESDERQRIIARTLQQRHPTWTFAGITAACLWRLDHSRYLDRRAPIVIAAVGHDVGMGSRGRLQRCYLPSRDIEQVEIRDGVRVTGITRTLFDCGRRYDFRDAMPFFDAAIRDGHITRDALLAAYDEPRLGLHQEKPMRLAQHANGLSENGGESFCYATMVESGVMLPRQQVEFVHPDDSRRRLRVDFLWELAGDVSIVAEFDGMRKYVDPEMTGGRVGGEVVADERARQDMLQRCGVNRIVRLTFDEVLKRGPMVGKLLEAGVPMIGA